MTDTRDHAVRNWLADNGLMTILFSALTIVLGLLLGEVQSVIGWSKLLLALVVVVVLLWITLWLVARPLTKILIELRADLMANKDSHGFSWLLDTPQLASYERNISTTEIWLLTSDLLDDTGVGPFHEVVEQNLRRKILHVYFYPNTPENLARANTIKSSHKQTTYLRFVTLPDNFFLLVPKLDIVIYNPRGLSGYTRTAFMGIPVPGDGQHYHAQVSLDLVDKIVGTLLEHYKASSGT